MSQAATQTPLKIFPRKATQVTRTGKGEVSMTHTRGNTDMPPIHNRSDIMKTMELVTAMLLRDARTERQFSSATPGGFEEVASRCLETPSLVLSVRTLAGLHGQHHAGRVFSAEGERSSVHFREMRNLKHETCIHCQTKNAQEYGNPSGVWSLRHETLSFVLNVRPSRPPLQNNTLVLLCRKRTVKIFQEFSRCKVSSSWYFGSDTVCDW